MADSLLPYALLLTGLLLIACLSRDQDRFAGVVTIALLAWTLLESGWSIVQNLVDGLGTYSYPFIISGSFRNPAPYGALNAIGLATATACIVRHRTGKGLLQKIQYALSLAVLIPGSIALLTSRSRAAWIALLIAWLVLLLRETDFRQWIHKHRFVAVAATCLLLLAGFAMFLMKKDSAIGRFHAWHMECRVIAGHPWTGVGFDRIFKAYGDAQSAYFQQAERPAAIVRVAGNPVYAFNEYLKFGMAWGIGGLLLSAGIAVWVVWRLFRRQSVLAYGALLFAIFAFASFPLSVVQLKLLGTVLLAVALMPDRKGCPGWLLTAWGIAFCACTVAAVQAYPGEKRRRDAERTWRSSLMQDMDQEERGAMLRQLYPDLKGNEMFLYQYGIWLRLSGSLEESNKVLQEGADLSCDPKFHTALAENHLAMGNIEAAEAEQMKAHWLVPSRPVRQP